MNAKNLVVFFLALASILLIANTVVAMEEIATIDIVRVDDVSALGEEVAVIAGETITVKVFFTALQTAADVKVKLELEGQKIDAEAVTQSFNIEKGKKYAKTLTLRIPYELQNEASDDTTLDIKIWNGDFRSEDDSIALRVQRPSYNAAIMTIDSSQTVEAGQIYPIDIVLKNTGYNNLDELYVTVKINALNLERTAYFGDLVAVDNDDDTETKRFYLQIPFDADAGLYTLDVEASNADLSVSRTKQITIENEFSASTIATTLRKAVGVNEDAEFELIVANPTNKLRVFRIVPESSGDVDVSANVQLIAVPAGTTKTVGVTATPHAKGEYNFDVSVFAGEELVDSVTLTVYASGRSISSNSTVALTIILIVVLLVLLGVLYMLLRKKPEANEELGESYY